MYYSYIIIYPEFKKYIELLDRIPKDYFVHILLNKPSEYIDPTNTLMIMYSKDSKYQASCLYMELIKDNFCVPLYSSNSLLNQDRYYLKTNNT